MYTVLCQDVDQPDRWFIASGFGNAIWPSDTLASTQQFVDAVNKMWEGKRIHKVFHLTEVPSA